MLKLIKLEYEKNQIWKWVRNAAIMTAVLCLFFFAQMYLGIAEDPSEAHDMTDKISGIAFQIELIASPAYLVFACVMHASFTVGGYKDGTMKQMFSYPIDRKKVLLSKILSVWIFSFLAMIVSSLIIYFVIDIAGNFLKPYFLLDFNLLSLTFYIDLIRQSALTVCISCIGLFVGMISKSTKATIVSSILLIIFMEGNFGSVSFKENYVLHMILVLISIIFVLLSIANVDKKDIV